MHTHILAHELDILLFGLIISEWLVADKIVLTVLISIASFQLCEICPDVHHKPQVNLGPFLD